MSRVRALVAAAVALTAAAVPCTAGAAGPQEPVRLLDVPYVPQSEALCGAAAAAMVMRYWGGGTVYAEAFAHLVDKDAHGIRAGDLIQALSDQGWEAASFKGDAAIVRKHLGEGRPVIALIEDRPERFHYVVVVGWPGGRVVAHDPARAPFRVYNQEAFMKAWSRSGFWTLLAMPRASRPAGGARDPAAGATAPADPDHRSCTSIVTEGVRLAGAGNVSSAHQLLELAIGMCPDAAAPRRELAGVHALNREWNRAAERAREALARDPGDTHAARILGTSLYLQDDFDGALTAWNRIGEPIIDLVKVVGLDRIRYEVPARLLGLQPREMLRQDGLKRARRRLDELPGAALTSVSYAPRDGGRATVEAVLVERPRVPTGLVPLGLLAARSLIDREVHVTVAGLTGGGEALAASWRWWARRPALWASFSAPSAVRGMGTIWRLEAAYDRQTYHSSGEVEEVRRTVSFAASDWLNERWRWELGIGSDRWTDRGGSVRLNTAIDWRSPDDRWTATARGALLAGSVATGTVSFRVKWRSDARREGAAWQARAGFEWAGDGAPYALWPGAGAGHARDVLLRAHPLLAEGVVRDGVFGRRLAHGGGELRHWLQPASRPWRLAPALFVDLARAARGGAGFDTRLHVDAGVGMRLGVPGGVVRIDLGRGLRDGAMALSAGWSR